MEAHAPRCRQTAEILFPGAEYHPVPDLRECDFGAFEGKSYEELKDDPAYRSWIDSGGEGEIPEGESAPAFRLRCTEAFASLWRTQSEGPFLLRCGLPWGEHHGNSRPYSGEGDFYRWQVKNAAGYFILWEESAWREEKRVKGFGPLPTGAKVTDVVSHGCLSSGLFIGSDFGRSPLDAPSGAGHGVVYPAGEALLRRAFPQTPGGERLAGAVLALSLPVGTFFLAAGAICLAGWVHPLAGFLLEAFWCNQILAAKGLRQESGLVYDALKRGDLEGPAKRCQ